ncbi:hypothetical protein F5Y17DRAFT_338511 [Xylariaceae sp. FL0594]|nr:hypothetical protein F5Y17DRAFT_338511 [Xylariaceae sp. FL0594]
MNKKSIDPMQTHHNKTNKRVDVKDSCRPGGQEKPRDVEQKRTPYFLVLLHTHPTSSTGSPHKKGNAQKKIEKRWYERNRTSQIVLDSRGIEPRTTPMLREYYTTKPQARLERKWIS